MQFNQQNHRFSVAPMLDWTDRHCRYFLRLLSKETVLYTEMVTTGAIIFGKGDYLSFNQQEHPLVLQLGGSCPNDMAKCAAIAQEYGYDEVNINVGCPSDRVKNGSFGACLMSSPEIVAACISNMQREVDIPITVKCRIGIDDMDENQGLSAFVEPLYDTGIKHIIVHARKAWLKGLSPKENRDIPPLNYERVYQLKQEFPDLFVSINGGIKTIAEAKAHLLEVDGVMMGREIYSNPYILHSIDKDIYGTEACAPISRESVVHQMSEYIHKEHEKGVKVWHIARHVLGLFQGQAGGKVWRRYLSENGTKYTASPNILMDAYDTLLSVQNKASLFRQND